MYVCTLKLNTFTCDKVFFIANKYLYFYCVTFPAFQQHTSTRNFQSHNPEAAVNSFTTQVSSTAEAEMLFLAGM